jgi:hypothetical protein
MIIEPIEPLLKSQMQRLKYQTEQNKISIENDNNFFLLEFIKLKAQTSKRLVESRIY